MVTVVPATGVSPCANSATKTPRSANVAPVSPAEGDHATSVATRSARTGTHASAWPGVAFTTMPESRWVSATPSASSTAIRTAPEAGSGTLVMAKRPHSSTTTAYGASGVAFAGSSANAAGSYARSASAHGPVADGCCGSQATSG